MTSILDTNLAVILDANTARNLGLTDEQLFAQVAAEIRRIPGVRTVYEYQLTKSEARRVTLQDEEIHPADKFRGDICM